jgi:hypothetical protein
VVSRRVAQNPFPRSWAALQLIARPRPLDARITMPYREEEDYESMSMDDGNCGPGPGEARGQSAVGYQTTSNRRSNHGFGFGTSVRGPMQQSVDTVPVSATHWQ